MSSDDSKPDISVVIPVRNGEATLPSLLTSLANQDLARDRYEIIVVDNASSDQTAAVARRFGCRVVYEGIPSRSGARNAGARLALADFIAFTDGDCHPALSWLSSVLACRGHASLIAGAIEIETRPTPNTIERFEAAWRFDQATWVTSGWAATANLTVERTAFDAIGGFDTGYRHVGEDVDFCLRARDAGFDLAYCDSAIVYHLAERTIWPAMHRAFLHGYSAAQVLRQRGVGHVAWRHPKPLLSPGAALEWHGVAPSSLKPRDRAQQAVVALVTYAFRVAGSIWARVLRVG